jgi:hypothetical protein
MLEISNVKYSDTFTFLKNKSLNRRMMNDFSSVFVIDPDQITRKFSGVISVIDRA